MTTHFQRRIAELAPPRACIDYAAMYAVEPVLIERRCGGWLAITPRGWPLGIGVTADTREDAVSLFRAEMERFKRIGSE